MMNGPSLRTIVLHYHLFKNAGTSVDTILKRSFGDRWITREFPPMGGNNTALVEKWIRETPEGVAYSSHTMMGPIPQLEGVRVISFMLLRDPIERIKSAYRFERTQQADTLGAKLAKKHNFEGWVLARLAVPGDRQCKNFQTSRLAKLVPGEGSELKRAQRALEQLTVVGLVEKFDKSMERLSALLKDYQMDIAETSAWRNKTDKSSTQPQSEVDMLLSSENQDDCILLALARGERPSQ